MKKIVIIATFITALFCGMNTSMAINDKHPEITTFVQQHFPKATVQTVIFDEGEYEVLLSDFTKLEFNRKYEWKSINCERSKTYTSVPVELVPKEISTYVSNNFPNTTITKLDKDRRGWDIELNNGLDIEFNKNFKPTEIDD